MGTLFALLLAAAAPGARAATPGSSLLEVLRRRFTAADVRVPLDLSRHEASAASWPTADPDWERAKESAGGLEEVRSGLVGDDADALEEGVRALAEALEIAPPGDDALAARYEALRESLNGVGASLEPETRRMRAREGGPLDDKDWRAHIEYVPLDVRRRLVTLFGPGAGIGAEPPKDPLAIIIAKKAAPKPAPPPVARRVALPKHAAKPAPRAAAAKAEKAAPAALGPKAAALAKAIKELGIALDAPSLAAHIQAADKAKLLSAWQRALEASTKDDGTTDFGMAVNGLRDLLPGPSPEARWARTAAASYNLGSDLGPQAALAATLVKTGTEVSAGRFFAKALSLAGAAPAPKADEPALGDAVRKAMAVESAAAGWAGSLPNPKKSDAINGTLKTLRLDGAVRDLRRSLGF